MRRVVRTWAMAWLIAAVVVPGLAADVGLDAATRQDAEATLARGVAWLQAQQAATGRIGSNEHVAVTALALRAVKLGGGSFAVGKSEQFLNAFLASNPTNPGFATFNAEVCRKVLRLPDPPGQAKQFDWATTLALRDRDDSARSREFELREIAWQKQRSELAKQGRDPDKFTAESLARTVVPASGLMPVVAASQPQARPRRARRGYGSMTYDGMMRLLHDDPKGNDPRVDAMVDWAERGWSLDENPGKGKAGLFYFYHAMAKCLDASGEEEILPLTGGAPIRWREEVVRKLVALQHIDKEKHTGYWVNENKSYMEDDPVLVTAYAMLALERAMGKKE